MVKNNNFWHAVVKFNCLEHIKLPSSTPQVGGVQVPGHVLDHHLALEVGPLFPELDGLELTIVSSKTEIGHISSQI